MLYFILLPGGAVEPWTVWQETLRKQVQFHMIRLQITLNVPVPEYIQAPRNNRKSRSVTGRLHLRTPEVGKTSKSPYVTPRVNNTKEWERSEFAEHDGNWRNMSIFHYIIAIVHGAVWPEFATKSILNGVHMCGYRQSDVVIAGSWTSRRFPPTAPFLAPYGKAASQCPSWLCNSPSPCFPKPTQRRTKSGRISGNDCMRKI